MRIAVVTADYPEFVNWLYRTTPGLEHASYERQLTARKDTLFGMDDFYSRNFAAFGHETRDFCVNNIWLQTAWARENGIQVSDPPAVGSEPQDSQRFPWLRRALRPYHEYLSPLARKLGLLVRLPPIGINVLAAQIEAFNPDVILNHNIILLGADVIRSWVKPGRVIIAQNGTSLPKAIDLSSYTFGVTMFPYQVEAFRAKGLPAEKVHLGFEPTILDRLPPAPEKDIDVSFVGAVGAGHQERAAMLEAVCQRFNAKFFLTAASALPSASPVLKNAQKSLWGKDMYQALRRSKITLNSHVDAAHGYASNMRLYEATGVGTCLLTDDTKDLDTLFAPGSEVATYSSPEDCVAKIERLLKDDALRESIARRGQERTLTCHTYRQRVETLLGLIGRYLP